MRGVPLRITRRARSFTALRWHHWCVNSGTNRRIGDGTPMILRLIDALALHRCLDSRTSPSLLRGVLSVLASLAHQRTSSPTTPATNPATLANATIAHRASLALQAGSHEFPGLRIRSRRAFVRDALKSFRAGSVALHLDVCRSLLPTSRSRLRLSQLTKAPTADAWNFLRFFRVVGWKIPSSAPFARSGLAMIVVKRSAIIAQNSSPSCGGCSTCFANTLAKLNRKRAPAFFSRSRFRTKPLLTPDQVWGGLFPENALVLICPDIELRDQPRVLL